jgi:nicotinamide mononucleotide adenylyltransferase
MYQYYAQVFETRDYEPLKKPVFQRRKENEERARAQAMATDESGD